MGLTPRLALAPPSPNCIAKSVLAATQLATYRLPASSLQFCYYIARASRNSVAGRPQTLDKHGLPHSPGALATVRESVELERVLTPSSPCSALIAPFASHAWRCERLFDADAPDVSRVLPPRLNDSSV
ncbi:hypothetical protein SCP_1403450 [Sparassis crispa]|uniref:Uncharacterized protein n=1 Tax=Sparassis crispa TaxID=139825 RepID=A0A401H3C7_9APHY|nr:hypothetical protein SCP_1403450 [Sparassis crispa]GBE88937.1 hypothetical protein SCP_1403450 [Sparassis crispa]